MIGTRLAHYEITGHLGTGGMGEVYQATDSRLGRSVAIKLLPEAFTHDIERVTRFEREARVVASLSHPNIALIHGIEESGGRKFLVMELVDGETLEQRIVRGAMPLDEAVAIAVQITEALESAHGKGVIHRDLKPANIKITPAGQVKVLDFGLARIFETESGDFTLSAAPTSMTALGAILGTIDYMSPEQARGKPVDKRTDIWAFGCVFFEMLTGRRAFTGETGSDLIAAILTRSPDMNLLPKVTPRRIADLIRRCVEKDPRLRLHDIADARIEITEASHPTNIQAGGRAERLPKRKTALLAALGFLALAMLGGTAILNLRPPAPTTWSGSMLVGGSTIGWGPRVSPDGRMVAFIVMVDNRTQVALMDAESGTWDVLTKLPVDGVHIHASWSLDGSRIYFTRGATTGWSVYSIPSVGGEEQLVVSNACFPEPLPDGSLLAARSNAAAQLQVYRFWPEQERKEEELPVYLAPGQELEPSVPIRAFADGKEAVFFGRTMTSKGLDSVPHVHIIDLASKQTRQLDSSLGVNASFWPVSVDRGHLVLSDVPTEDLHRVVKLDPTGGVPPRELFALTGRFAGLDMSADGTIFVDQQNSTLEVLRISPSDGSIKHVARADDLLGIHAVELPDGRVIVSSLVSGRSRLMLKTNKLATPLMDTPEATSGPISVVGNDRAAFLLGSGLNKSVAIGSLSDRRILGRIPSIPDAASITQLAASADGTVLYYISENKVWKVSVAGGAPRQIAERVNSIAVDPQGPGIILQRIGPVRLFRIVMTGRSEEEISQEVIKEEEIKIDPAVRIGAVALAANAVNKDGKILVTTALDANTWYWQVSVLDPKTGQARRVPTDFAGDILFAGWTSSGQILATGVNTEGSIWRFRPQTP